VQYLDLQTECKKYGHPEYSEHQVDGLMQYFRLDTYDEFLDFLKRYKSE
jgi:hypothetical protein